MKLFVIFCILTPLQSQANRKSVASSLGLEDMDKNDGFEFGSSTVMQDACSARGFMAPHLAVNWQEFSKMVRQDDESPGQRQTDIRWHRVIGTHVKVDWSRSNKGPRCYTRTIADEISLIRYTTEKDPWHDKQSVAQMEKQLFGDTDGEQKAGLLKVVSGDAARSLPYLVKLPNSETFCCSDVEPTKEHLREQSCSLLETVRSRIESSYDAYNEYEDDRWKQERDSAVSKWAAEPACDRLAELHVKKWAKTKQAAPCNVPCGGVLTSRSDHAPFKLASDTCAHCALFSKKPSVLGRWWRKPVQFCRDVPVPVPVQGCASASAGKCYLHAMGDTPDGNLACCWKLDCVMDLK